MKGRMRRCLVLVVAVLVAGSVAAGEAGRKRGPTPSVKGSDPSPLAARNTWVKVDEGLTGPRFEPGLVYLPGEQTFLLFGGAMRHEKRPYDEMTFDPKSGTWTNRFPKGKENVWGPALGDVKAPYFKRREYFGIGDAEGNPRFNVYGGMQLYYQYAHDTDANRVYVHGWNRTVRYDPGKRTWKDLAPKATPGGGSSLVWGSMCYVPETKEILLVGAGHAETLNGYSGTWVYSPAANVWRKLAFGSAGVNGLRASAERLRARAQDLVAACRNRFNVTETPEAAKADLASAVDVLLRDIAALGQAARDTEDADAYETVQMERARALLTSAAAGAGSLSDRLRAGIDTTVIVEIFALEEALRRARNALAVEPPPRGMSPLVYDPQHSKVVFFGGDGHARFYADTWVFDPSARRWREMRPPVSPGPRAGHALVYLPRSQSIVLLGRSYRPRQTPPPQRGEWGGVAQAPYETMPFEMWRYDLAANRWTLIRRYANEEGPPAAMRRSDTSVFAVSEDDLVVGLGRRGFYKATPSSTWACRIDPTAVDEAGTAKFGVRPGAEVYHIGPNDPATYDREPAADPTAVEAALKALPANTWVYLKPPNVPATRNGGTWGSCIFDPVGDQFLWWAGGHSSYCGNEVVHYAIRTNRWSMSYRPGHPLNWVASNGGGPGLRDFDGHPWMCQHPYRWYAYDPVLRRMVYVQGGRTYTYDPVRREWDERSFKSPIWHERLVTVSTPHGVVSLGRQRDDITHLYRFDGERGWIDLPRKGKRIPWPYCDRSTAIYDSRRDRILVTGRGQGRIPHGGPGQVAAYDMKTSEITFLSPAGSEAFPPGNCRESIYIPEHDLVLFGIYATTDGEIDRTYVYDVGGNRWRTVRFKPALPGLRKGQKRYGLTAYGLMYDPNRRLVFAVTTHGYHAGFPYVLRFDPKTADFVDPE